MFKKVIPSFIILSLFGLSVAAFDIAQPVKVKETKEPALANDQDVSGVYKITGLGANGKTYSGGVGMMVEKHLVVSWKQGETLGITCITFAGRDGKAKWLANPGSGNFNNEVWTFLAGNDED